MCTSPDAGQGGVETKKLNPKVKASGAAGGFGIVIVWVAGQLGLEMPPEVAAALAALLATLAGYLRSA